MHANSASHCQLQGIIPPKARIRASVWNRLQGSLKCFFCPQSALSILAPASYSSHANHAALSNMTMRCHLLSITYGKKKGNPQDKAGLSGLLRANIFLRSPLSEKDNSFKHFQIQFFKGILKVSNKDMSCLCYTLWLAMVCLVLRQRNGFLSLASWKPFS